MPQVKRSVEEAYKGIGKKTRLSDIVVIEIPKNQIITVDGVDSKIVETIRFKARLIDYGIGEVDK